MEETRLVLKNADRMNPVSSREYVKLGGYQGLCKAIAEPESLLEMVDASGLRGLGGAGFPVGIKWKSVRDSAADQKYVVCNGEEGEPGTLKDRTILLNAPHSVLEGMAICAAVVGASQGMLYLHPDNRQAAEIVGKAIEDAYENGYLGKGLCGSDFDFDLEIRSGTGAYVCGEETGLLESIEGNRDEPRLKPPYPVSRGLWAKPTVINNVETLANIPVIATLGVEGYRRYGTEKCPGTRIFTLSGSIVNPGVYEFPMGVTLRQMFEDVGGGCPNGKRLQGVQVGGCASGAFIKPDMLDLRLDIESCAEAGIPLGTGSLMFFDEDANVIELCHGCMAFFADQSCGRCTPCRCGNSKIADLLADVLAGRGYPGCVETLERLSEYVMRNSSCGLGQTSSTPLISTLKNFHDDFMTACSSTGENAYAGR